VLLPRVSPRISCGTAFSVDGESKARDLSATRIVVAIGLSIVRGYGVPVIDTVCIMPEFMNYDMKRLIRRATQRVCIDLDPCGGLAKANRESSAMPWRRGDEWENIIDELAQVRLQGIAEEILAFWLCRRRAKKRHDIFLPTIMAPLRNRRVER
jgi:hypothetical protein